VEDLVVRLDALAFGGDAVGRDEGGRVVFVPGGAPGDTVRVRLVEKKRAWARGELVQLIEPGAVRVAPPCPLAARCGGCPWQHVTVEAQRAAKQEIVRRALGAAARVEPIVAAPAALGYRTRARMTARGGALGFQQRRSRRVVDVETCPALDPALDRALGRARRALGGQLGEGGSLSGLVGPDGRVHLAVAAGEGAHARRLHAEAARLVDGAIVGVLVDEAAMGARELELGDGLSGSADGFQQANRTQNEVLRRLVATAARAAGARVLELYAGDGNFTRDLVRAASGGVAVEGERRAAARLRQLVGGAPSWSVRTEPAARAVDRLARDGEGFDVVVLDPPRAGAADVLDGLVALAPARIVYVSCDPMTLARDLGRLGAAGFGDVRAQPIDMMPHTSHVEVVCTLEPSAAHPR
jgi:23S rRNA (uracil1939-C5)-methyltransferase